MPGPPPPLIGLHTAAVAGVSGLGPLPSPFFNQPWPISHPEALLHYSFPSEADTLAYVDTLKHSDLSDWRSLQEVAARAGAGSCSGAVTTSVLTALYLLGLFNLCVASPASCCVPPPSSRRRRRSPVDPTLPPLLNHLQHNLSSLSLEQFRALPHVATADGGRVPLHISVVEQVRKLWDSNPRLLSSVSCSSATQAVRSSFISLSGVASGIILAYSVAQLNQCYPDHAPSPDLPHKIWFFPIPKSAARMPSPPPTPDTNPIPVLPRDIPVPGEDEAEDGCGRDEVSLGSDSCATLLSSTPCPYKHWVLLNHQTRTGECVPRLCADNLVYLESDQLCHDVNEPGLCPGERRLYITATGTAVCDCPEGMFGGPGDSCYYLHETAYCREGSVLQFDRSSKSLACLPDPCRPANSDLWPDDLPFAPSRDGYCYQFNEEKPCKRGERFGYDTDRLEATCVSLMEAGLSRPRRSFMYQQMSYPASRDRQYHHYQVSYIIMNGTTWDLEVKGVKRAKRDVFSLKAGSPHLTPSGHLAVPFIDTRDIHRDLFPLIRPRRPRWVTHRRTRRGNTRTHNATLLLTLDGNEDESNGNSQRNTRQRKSRTHNANLPQSVDGDDDAESNGHSRKNTRHRHSRTQNTSMNAYRHAESERPRHSSRRGNSRTTTTSTAAPWNANESDTTDNHSQKSNTGNSDEPNPGRKGGQRGRSRGRAGRRGRGGKGGGRRRKTTEASSVNDTLSQNHDSDEIVRVSQTSAAEPIVVDQTPSETGEDSSTRRQGSRRRKSRKKGKGRKRKKGRRRRKKKKGRRRGRKRKDRPSTPRNSTRTRGKKKRKNPKLPYRVPTVLPPTPFNTSEGDNEVTGATNSSSDNNQTSRDNTTNIEEADKDEDDQELSSSSEMSLPKYLRHRDRRQLGDGGGIIQAPLLSACKPGAKRDYNYKCRPRFIPQGRDRRVTNGAVAAPRKPTITCPEGTRLDPRGKCQMVG